MPDYQGRSRRVQEQMAAQQIDLLFLPICANLHYLTGIGREEPNFGNTMYPGEWVTGAWIPQTGEPILTLPRMLAEFHMGHVSGFDVRVLPDADDPLELAGSVLQHFGIAGNGAIAVEDRAWAETLINLRTLVPDVRFSQASALIMPLRRIKDEDEIAIMREAGVVTEAAYAATLAQLKHGMTNLDLISEVRYQLRETRRPDRLLRDQLLQHGCRVSF